MDSWLKQCGSNLKVEMGLIIECASQSRGNTVSQHSHALVYTSFAMRVCPGLRVPETVPIRRTTRGGITYQVMHSWHAVLLLKNTKDLVRGELFIHVPRDEASCETDDEVQLPPAAYHEFNINTISLIQIIWHGRHSNSVRRGGGVAFLLHLSISHTGSTKHRSE